MVNPRIWQHNKEVDDDTEKLGAADDDTEQKRVQLARGGGEEKSA